MPKTGLISLKEIPKVAAKTARSLKGGEVFALIGPLGSGKTTFVKALGKRLKIKQKITSPSFTLLQSYPIKLKGKQILLYHLDLYRIKNFKEAAALGLTEFWGKSNSLTFIEWGNKIKRHLPAKTQVIKFIIG